MTSLTFYGGVNEVGGNKILLEDKDTKVFLDFGKGFSRRSKFFENFLEANERYEDFRNNFDRINQVSGTVAYRLGANWLVRYQGGYSFERSFSLTHRGAIEYVSQCDCWAVGVEARKNRDTGVEFNLVYRMVGLGKDAATSRGSGPAQFSFLDGI